MYCILYRRHIVYYILSFILPIQLFGCHKCNKRLSCVVFAWKSLFTPPKSFLEGEGGEFKINLLVYGSPKAGFDPIDREILAWKDVIWRMNRKNRSTGTTCTFTVANFSPPRRLIEIRFGMVGVTAIVVSFKFHQNQLSGSRGVRGQPGHIPLAYIGYWFIQRPVL